MGDKSKNGWIVVLQEKNFYSGTRQELASSEELMGKYKGVTFFITNQRGEMQRYDKMDKLAQKLLPDLQHSKEERMLELAEIVKLNQDEGVSVVVITSYRYFNKAPDIEYCMDFLKREIPDLKIVVDAIDREIVIPSPADELNLNRVAITRNTAGFTLHKNVDAVSHNPCVAIIALDSLERVR